MSNATRRTKCGLCGSGELVPVLEFPQVPLTGIYLAASDPSPPITHDLTLMCCAECGQGQLLDSLSPELLYKDTYTHRSSLSPIAKSGNDFFYQLFLEQFGNRRFRCVADIGCNDLYLLNALRQHADLAVGIDPMWEGREVNDAGLKTVGKFVESIDWSKDIGAAPDLIVSAHTFEHLEEPRALLERLLAVSAPDAVFMIEVPSFDALLWTRRFDQVFHQHLNYYGLGSWQRALRSLGLELITHRYNYSYWNGTLHIVFRKARASVDVSAPAITARGVGERYRQFAAHLDLIRADIDQFAGRGTPVVGFGAAQMFPVLDYHLKSGIKVIYDDNQEKRGKRYPGTECVIAHSSEFADIARSAVIITALDSTRSIYPMLCARGARHILTPAVVS